MYNTDTMKNTKKLLKKNAEGLIALEESSVTVKGYRHRTTIPRRVFQFLELRDKDKLRWILREDGTIIVQRL